MKRYVPPKRTENGQGAEPPELPRRREASSHRASDNFDTSTMSKQYIGCTVSVKCIEELGTYQGLIIDVNKQYITLAQAFCNGVPHDPPTVSLMAKDILNVEIISKDEPTPSVSDAQPQPPPQPKVVVKRPIAKRASRVVPENIPPIMPSAAFHTQHLKKPHEVAQYVDQSVGAQAAAAAAAVEPQGRPIQKKMSQRQRALERDEHTFGTPIDQSLNQDFDFEKNLALFNKEAVWQELNSLKPDIVRQSESNRGNAGIYRHDENILVAEPIVLRQIVVPCESEKEYVTDNGLVIPSISLSLHRQLLGAADRFGISWERRMELFGRAATEIALQLLGGSHRLNPNNAHQWPTVVALCGPHRSGAAGVNCARQLSSHGVKTIVYVEGCNDVFLLQELTLYRQTENRVETKVRNLPTGVDLILVALCDENSPRNVSPVARWASNNRAPILAIEPPASGTPGIVSKFSLLGALPLAHCADNGRLYLCNLALPRKVYSDVGIQYKSPFGPKFVIPLYMNNSS